jgi:hypothetical protein
MEVTVHIPDTIGARLSKDTGDVPRWLLEKAGLEAYRSRESSSYELRLMLGMKSRFELDAFLKTHGVHLEYTDEDFAHDAETSRQLKRKQAQANMARSANGLCPYLFKTFLDAHYQR